jgi:hypothetical protein
MYETCLSLNISKHLFTAASSFPGTYYSLRNKNKPFLYFYSFYDSIPVFVSFYLLPNKPQRKNKKWTPLHDHTKVAYTIGDEKIYHRN